MKVLNFFRKPYLAYLAGLMLLFVSCKQYDSFETKNELMTPDVTRIKNEMNNVRNYIDKKNIKDFSDINEVKRILLSNKSGNDLNITEDDINQVYSFANDMGLFDPGMNNNLLTINLINYGFNNNLLSVNLKDFMISKLSIYAISDESIKAEFQNYLSNNITSLTDFEQAFLNSFINSNLKAVPCSVVGFAVGLGAGLLLGAVTGGIAAGIGSGVFGHVAERMCETL